MTRISKSVLSVFLCAFVYVLGAHAQTTEFTYHGQLQSSSVPANGSHDFEFVLFDAAAGGNQVGGIDTRAGVTVTNGLFSVRLDFGPSFPGAARFLEIRVRQSGAGPFTALAPRQSIGSAPYSIKSLAADTAQNATNAVNATNAATASNALQLNGLPASQYLQINGDASGLNGINATSISTGTLNSARFGVIPVTSGGTGSSTLNFVDLTNAQTIGGAKSFSSAIGALQYNIAGSRFLGTSGIGNVYAGLQSGAANPTGSNNSFFGAFSGVGTTSGTDNTMVGFFAGGSSAGASFNSFFGSGAGSSGTQAGGDNSFFGVNSGYKNTGSQNNFFGRDSGFNNVGGIQNAFVGNSAGYGNTSGNFNSFVGHAAGLANTSGQNNTALGYSANFGSGGLSYASAIGAGSVATQSNTIVLGRDADTVTVPGSFAVTGTTTFSGTLSANILNATTQFNLGGTRILSAPGNGNTFAGSNAGTQLAFNSAFFGAGAGAVSIAGANSFFGSTAGASNTSGSSNSFFGFNAGFTNTTGASNSFFGWSSGAANTDGNFNTFFGFQTGIENTTGTKNTLIGASAGLEMGNLTNATAIGTQALVAQSNSLVLGSIVNLNGATAGTDVGIGTAVPAFKLHVVDTSNRGLRVQTNSTAGVVASFGGNGAFQIDSPGVAGGRMNVKENGNVGIGTNNPNTKLQVTGGSVYISNPNSLIITSPNGACWFITVNNAGALSTLPVACP